MDNEDRKEEMSQEVYPGIDRGMVENFVQGKGLFNPETQTAQDMGKNYRAMAALMASGKVTFKGGLETMAEYGMDEDRMVELTERAYLNSEAFRQRAVRSLGYERLEDMTPEHRKQYDFIVQRAEMSNTKLHVVKDSFADMQSLFVDAEGALNYVNEMLQNKSLSKAERKIQENNREFIIESIGGVPEKGDGLAVINEDEKYDLGVDVMPHEMAHYVYNKDEVNPGVHEKENDYSGKRSAYGKDDSPLNNIDREKIKLDTKWLQGAFFLDPLTAEYIMQDQKGVGKQMRERRYVHDSAGFERAADIHATRVQMFKDGVYNPFDGSDLKEEQLRKYKEMHPTGRLPKSWNGKEMMFFMNNIALNDSLKETVGKNILAAIEEDDRTKEDKEVLKAPDASVGAGLAAAAFQKAYDNRMGENEQVSKGLSV